MPRVTIARVEEYLALQEKRRDLNRQADALEREEKVIAAELVALVESDGGKARVVTKGSHKISLVEKPGSVRWKDEFIRVAGADEATALQANCPPRLALTVS